MNISLFEELTELCKKLPALIEGGVASEREIRLMALLIEAYSEVEGYFPMYAMKHSPNYKHVFNE